MLKKLLCGLLASLMILGTLASCAETADDPAQETADTGSASTDAEETETRETLDIPDTRYDSETLTFLTRDESEWSTLEIFTEKLTSESDNISSAVYERNITIQDKYGVVINELKKPTGEHHGAVSQEIAGSTGDFQAIVTNTAQSCAFALQGMLYNLNGEYNEYIDTQKPWWDTVMADGLSINGYLYFATGDILTSDNDATFVILFNKKLATECKLPDLYAAVENNEWTMEQFYNYMQTSKQDKDGDGKLTYNTDVCGFAYTGDAPYCFLFGGGITICGKDANDFPTYNLNVERAQNISDMGKLLFSKDYAVDMNAAVLAGDTIMHVGQITFGENHALFFAEVMQSVTRMRGYDVDFGILPFPMYDLNQNGYISMMHTTASQVSIPKSVQGEKLSMTCAMIEAMAYYAVDTLTTQYYEINLKTKGAKDEKSGPMIDKILANRACDLTYYFTDLGSGAFGTLAGTLLPTSNKSVSSASKAFKRQIERSADRIVENLEKNETQ